MFRSLALVDVVPLAPWGSDFFRLVTENSAVFAALPPPLHEALVRADVAGAAHRPLPVRVHDALVRLELVPGAGHLAQVEAPELLTATLLRWLLERRDHDQTARGRPRST